jgi:prepilin-type processing-associated H-X9-DG protein
MNDLANNPRPRFPRLLSLLLVIAVLLIARGIFLTWWEDTMRSANGIKSAANLKQLGAAMRDYADDHAGQYPDSFTTLLLGGYATPDLFVSPQSIDSTAAGPTTQAVATDLTSGGHLSYVYLAAGTTAQTLKLDKIIAYETPQNYPHGIGSHVLFGDGHVEFWTGDKLSALKPP